MLSVIVSTSPGREANLDAALACLLHQSLLPAEIIVVDDGSTQGEAVTRHHEKQQQHSISFHYLWRPNDRCVARSRNLGADLARQPFIVCLDGDVLLNPQALKSYALYLSDFPDHAVYGYFGYQWNYRAPSFLVPGREVLWCDRRFVRYTPRELVAAPNMLRYPHEWAWSGNFAMGKNTFLRAGGFDTAYTGWGGEDLDFAWRLIQEGTPLHFLLDAWGEQQYHERTEAFHTGTRGKTYVSHYVSPNYTPEVRFSPEAEQRLRRVIFSHYVPKGRMLRPEPEEFQPEIVGQ